jgi:hypothetical protein
VVVVVFLIILFRRGACMTDSFDILPALQAINKMAVRIWTRNKILFSRRFPGLTFFTD